MFVVTVTEPDGAHYSRVFDRDTIIIGRYETCDLVLPDGNVSGRHAKLSLKDGKFILSDMKSTNGVYVNGRQVSAPMVIAGANTIHIAVFLLSVSQLREG